MIIENTCTLGKLFIQALPVSVILQLNNQFNFQKNQNFKIGIFKCFVHGKHVLDDKQIISRAIFNCTSCTVATVEQMFGAACNVSALYLPIAC